MIAQTLHLIMHQGRPGMRVGWPGLFALSLVTKLQNYKPTKTGHKNCGLQKAIFQLQFKLLSSHNF